MAKSFPGFSPKALVFLRQLKKNNSRDWFTPRKPQFEELLRKPMLELTGMVADQMRGFAVDYVRDPAKAVHRIYRDVRFSKDKSPYKTNISAMFFRAGLSKNLTAGFYFSISAEAIEIAGGLYMPSPVELNAVRAKIIKNPAEFSKAVLSPSIVKMMGNCQGDSIKRLPKGFEQTDPATHDLLRRKQFYYFKELESDQATKPGLDRLITQSFRTMAPMIDYLNQIFLTTLRSTTEVSTHPRRPAPMF